MPRPVVIDISHHQTIPESLIPARQSGIIGVIHKATEGAGYVDDKFAARRHLAVEAGLLFGAYHFIRPGDPVAQADHFLAVAQPDEKMLLALDHEDAGVSLDAAKAFLERVKAMSGRSPVIYSGHVLKDQLAGEADAEISKYRLWLAQYGPEAELPPGFDCYWLWQYTDQGSVPGIKPPTDLNDFQGTATQLFVEWAGFESFNPPRPWPPMPDAQRVNLRISLELRLTTAAGPVSIGVPTPTAIEVDAEIVP